MLHPRHFFSPGTFTRFTRFLHNFTRFYVIFAQFYMIFTQFYAIFANFTRFLRDFLPGKNFSIPGTKNYYLGLAPMDPSARYTHRLNYHQCA